MQAFFSLGPPFLLLFSSLKINGESQIVREEAHFCWRSDKQKKIANSGDLLR